MINSSEFDFLEMEYIKDGLELLRIATRQCQKENECYDEVRFKQIGEAKLEIIENIIKKLKQEEETFLPTKVSSLN